MKRLGLWCWCVMTLLVCNIVWVKGQTDPTSITCAAVNTTCLQLSWTSATSASVLGYHLEIKRVDGLKVEPDIPTMTLADRTYNSYAYNGLGKYGTYNITIHSYTASGNLTDYISTCTTAEDVPDSAPQNFVCTAISISAINCSWDALAQGYWNGILLGYQLQWVGSNGSLKFDVNVSASTVDYSATGLYYDHKYVFLLNGYTAVGFSPVYNTDVEKTFGPPAPEVENKTKYYCYEAVPGMIEFGWDEMPCTIYMGTIAGLFTLSTILLGIFACQACCSSKPAAPKIELNLNDERPPSEPDTEEEDLQEDTDCDQSEDETSEQPAASRAESLASPLSQDGDIRAPVPPTDSKTPASAVEENGAGIGNAELSDSDYHTDVDDEEAGIGITHLGAKSGIVKVSADKSKSSKKTKSTRALKHKSDSKNQERLTGNEKQHIGTIPKTKAKDGEESSEDEECESWDPDSATIADADASFVRENKNPFKKAKRVKKLREKTTINNSSKEERVNLSRVSEVTSKNEWNEEWGDELETEQHRNTKVTPRISKFNYANDDSETLCDDQNLNKTSKNKNGSSSKFQTFGDWGDDDDTFMNNSDSVGGAAVILRSTNDGKREKNVAKSLANEASGSENEIDDEWGTNEHSSHANIFSKNGEKSVYKSNTKTDNANFKLDQNYDGNPMYNDGDSVTMRTVGNKDSTEIFISETDNAIGPTSTLRTSNRSNISKFATKQQVLGDTATDGQEEWGTSSVVNMTKNATDNKVFYVDETSMPQNMAKNKPINVQALGEVTSGKGEIKSISEQGNVSKGAVINDQGLKNVQSMRLNENNKQGVVHAPNNIVMVTEANQSKVKPTGMNKNESSNLHAGGKKTSGFLNNSSTNTKEIGIERSPQIKQNGQSRKDTKGLESGASDHIDVVQIIGIQPELDPRKRKYSAKSNPAWTQEKPKERQSMSGRRTPVKPIRLARMPTPEPVLGSDRLGKKFPFLQINTDNTTEKSEPSPSKINGWIKKNKSEPALDSLAAESNEKTVPIAKSSSIPKSASTSNIEDVTPDTNKIFYGFGVGKFRKMAANWVQKWRMKKQPPKTGQAEWS